MFESSTGWDEEAQAPRFSCIFYLTGRYTHGDLTIRTYYPAMPDTIGGRLQLQPKHIVRIKLNEEPGGCWNVQPFSNAFVDFQLKKITNWLEIRYITTPKAFFYTEKKEETRQKAYLVAGDFVCIDKLEKEWVHGFYYGKKTTHGWIKRTALNKLL